MISMAFDRAFSPRRHLGLKTRLQFPFSPITVSSFRPAKRKAELGNREVERLGLRVVAILGSSSLPLCSPHHPPIMAAIPSLPYSDDNDSLPCAAPTPLPPPPSQSLAPDPAVMLTPEQNGARRVNSGILRLHRQGKLPRRQVRFSVESLSDDVTAISLEPPREREEPPTPTETPYIPIRLERELSRVSAEDTMLLPPSVLAAPIPHSTLALGAEVQAAREQGFNARQAAEELVQRSFVARCALEARVGEGLNIPRDQQLYQGLVSLQVPKEELLNSAVQEKLALVRHRPEGRQELPCTGPDLLAFYNPGELFTETPFLEVEGLPALKLQPRPRDPATTFFMYQKLHQWDS